MGLDQDSKGGMMVFNLSCVVLLSCMEDGEGGGRKEGEEE